MNIPSVRSLLPKDFASTYWRKAPLLIRGDAVEIADLITAEEIDQFEEDFFAAPASWRTNSVGKIGSTSYIGNGECLNENLAQLCVRFRTEFEWPHAEIALVRNREATSWVPSGPHFDQVDNFIVQGAGTKLWRLWPTDRVSAEEKRRRVLKQPQYGEVAISPATADLVEVTMEPGDLLYVPLFWGHSVRSLGPGVMLSVNLKALLASQVLLSGMLRNLPGMTGDSEPMPLPLEVDDWDAESRRRMSAAFDLVSRSLAPAGGGVDTDTTTTAEAGVRGFASHRHELLLKPVARCGELHPIAQAQALNSQITATRLNLAAAEAFPPVPEAKAALLEAFSLIHLHRFLGLLVLGPQPWWPTAIRGEWQILRERIESIDLATLTRCGADSELVEQTTRFRDDLTAFNRRHAAQSLRGWADLVARLTVTSTPAAPGVFTDAAGRLPATQEMRLRIRQAIEQAGDVWPTFPTAFAAVIQAVTTDPVGRQTPTAAQRARVAVVDPRWPASEIAIALVGELGRVTSHLIARIGSVAPDAVPHYGDDFAGPATEIARAAAFLGVAAYLDARDTPGAGASHRDFAASLLQRVDQSGLTRLGRDLTGILSQAAAGKPMPSSVAPVALGDILADIELHQRTGSQELVDGHVQANARFRWSDLRRDEVAVGAASAGTGMDCGIRPWLIN